MPKPKQEDLLEKDGKMLANTKVEADNVGLRWGGIVNVARPSPNQPPNLGVSAAADTVIEPGSGSQQAGLRLPQVVVWAQRVVQGLSTKYLGLFSVKVGCVRPT